ncbi:hypothetical protein CEXT_483051 [Caerostris extrusa]|uniref:Uncharacterized protein n=1 Tax=Caerostris extrusa TaxID=172846 RepID=A0AAV4U816_CAEEX|nr:hypothetical protein CEXT_483051 [Caerostris extrusa]
MSHGTDKEVDSISPRCAPSRLARNKTFPSSASHGRILLKKRRPQMARRRCLREIQNGEKKERFSLFQNRFSPRTAYQYSTAINIEAIPLAKMAPSTPQCTGARLAAGVRLGYQRPDVTQWASCMSPGAVAVNKPPPLPYLAAAGPP